MADPVPAIVDLQANGKKKAMAKRPEVMPPVNPDPWLATVERLAPSIGVDGIKELMALRREERALDAQREFNTAMADARSELKPIIKKNLVQFGSGDRQTSYRHETLGDIAEMADPILGKHGLFYRYRSSSEPNQPVTVTCIIAHRSGYSEETTLSAGADATGGKNSIQAIGSATTYLQRYTLRLALGLATANDDDGRGASEPVSRTITEAQEQALKAMIMKCGNQINLRAFYEVMKIANLSDLPASRFAEVEGQLKRKLEKLGIKK